MSLPLPKQFNIEFNELEVPRNSMLNLMGYDDYEAPDPIPEILDQIIEDAPGYSQIQGGYIMIDDFSVESGIILQTHKLEFNMGKVILHQLKKAEKIVFYLMTAGPGLESWSREAMNEGDPLAAYIIDLLGSELVERGMDQMQAVLAEEMAATGFHISNRYSPGYCDWHVREQQKLFKLFPENYCGISLSESSLMLPIKSVSGIIGIGKHLKKSASSCDICGLKDCYYRNRQTTSNTYS